MNFLSSSLSPCKTSHMNIMELYTNYMLVYRYSQSSSLNIFMYPVCTIGALENGSHTFVLELLYVNIQCHALKLTFIHIFLERQIKLRFILFTSHLQRFLN
jgi:hypothetical protein